MNSFSSGNASVLSSVLMTSNKASAGQKPNEARDSGAEFHAAMQDVARTKPAARPEPAARQRPADRAEPRPAPASHVKTAPTRGEEHKPVDKTAKPDVKQPADEVTQTTAGLASDAADGASRETGEEASVLLAEAGLMGLGEATKTATDNSTPLAPEVVSANAELDPDLLIAPLAPEMSGATVEDAAVGGITLPPLNGTPAATTDASARLRNLVGEGSKTANLAVGESIDGLKTAVAETSDGEGGLLELDGETSLEDFKLPFSRLLAAQGVAGKEAQTVEQNLAKLLNPSAAPAIDAATRPAEAQAQAPSQRGFIVQTGVPMALGQPRWGQAVGERVLWLAAQNVSSAELRLDPPELGPMQVRVSIHQDQASVSFSSPHPLVREALDQSATRLREMFNEQGLNLTQMDVSDQSFARQNARDETASGGSGHGTDAEMEEEENLVGITTDAARVRLVDHYA